ncbi:MucBP domain-containing protein [Lactococcus garvieae]|uniref:MucBP domain-containing protein n=1 Tax=Lactococcus garvieae TaxID=1363 RepID=UPI003853C0A2
MKKVKGLLLVIACAVSLFGVKVFANDINTHVGGTGSLSGLNAQYQLQGPIPSGITLNGTSWTANLPGKYDLVFAEQRNIDFSVNWKGHTVNVTTTGGQKMKAGELWEIVFFLDGQETDRQPLTSVPDGQVQTIPYSSTIASQSQSLKVEIQLNGVVQATQDVPINNDLGFDPINLGVSLTDSQNYHINVADKVVIEYLDTSGNHLAQDDYTIDDYSKPYNTTPKVFSGYTLKQVQGNQKSTYDENVHIIDYIYEKVKEPEVSEEKGQIVVHYQDTDGNQLLMNHTEVGEVGKSYTTSAPKIPGFILKDVRGDKSGTFINGTKEIFYIYEKISVPVKGGSEGGNLSKDTQPLTPSTPAKSKEKVNDSKTAKTTLPKTGTAEVPLWFNLLGLAFIILSIALLVKKNKIEN